LRVHLIATGVPADEIDIASRLRPGHWGLSAGMVAGGGSSQPAAAAWWLWDRLGLRLTAGGTFASGSQPGKLMLGCGVQVPLGSSSSKAPSTPASTAPASTAPAGAAPPRAAPAGAAATGTSAVGTTTPPAGKTSGQPSVGTK
jgi:hypothetical protein